MDLMDGYDSWSLAKIRRMACPRGGRSLWFHSGTASRRTASRISGLRRSADDHLNGPFQQMLEIGDKTARKPRRRFSRHVDEEVNIAFGCFFSASHGTKEPHISRPVTRSHARMSSRRC